MRKLLALLILTPYVFCHAKDIDTKTLSKALGHIVGKNIKNTPAKIDEKAFLEGVKESFSGKIAPLSDDELVSALTVANEKAHQEMAKANLKTAEEFLEKNSHQKDIIDIADGKLQYKIEHQGKGNTVHSYNTPLIRYKGKYLNGTVFCESFEPEKVCLSEANIGFQKGIEGMKEGEKRTIFIHPSLGYGEKGALLPNSLLTYEVELIKADVSEKQIDLQHEKLITSQEQ